MKKLFISLFLCILLLPLLPAMAEEGDFTIDTATGFITAYSGKGGEVVVPDAINGVSVTGIGTAVFSQNQALTAVRLPETLTHILPNAFYFCENLESINLPAGLQAIDVYAFFSCGKLSDLIFPPSLVIIDSNAFNFCSGLKTIRFTGGLPVIGPDAFANSPEDRTFTVPGDMLSEFE